MTDNFDTDRSIDVFEYRPVRPFIQIPEKVMVYVLGLTPSSFSKVYLYIYNLSYGLGRDYTQAFTSVREISSNLNISIGRTQNAMAYFKKINAFVKIVSKAVIGSKYKVNVPEYSAQSGSWYFVEPVKVKYLLLKEKLITSDSIVESKIKRYKSIRESLKIEIFDNPEE